MSNIVYIVCRASHRHGNKAENVLEQWTLAERTWWSTSPTWVELSGQSELLPTPQGVTLIGDEVVYRRSPSFVAAVNNALTPHAGRHRLSYFYECEECPTPRGASVKVTYEKLTPILDKVLETGGNELEVGVLQMILTT